MQRAWILALALCACGGSSKSAPTTVATNTAPPPSHTCANTADHMLDLMSASAKAPPEQVKAVHDAIVTHCTDDKWTDEVMTCIGKATEPAGVEKCDDLLTPAQKEALSKDGAEPPPPKGTQPVKSMQGGSRGPKKGGDPCDGGE